MIAPVMSRAAVDISRLWCERDPNAWMRAVAATRARGVTLVEVLRDRYLWMRDLCAREAFDRQLPAWQPAREWRVELAEGGPVLIQVSGTGPKRRGLVRLGTQVPAIYGERNGSARPGGESCPS